MFEILVRLEKLYRQKPGFPKMFDRNRVEYHTTNKMFSNLKRGTNENCRKFDGKLNKSRTPTDKNRRKTKLK